MKPSDQLVISALKKLAQQPNQIVANDKIPAVYKGYISSFGGTIVQSGILQTCLAFYASDNGKKPSRKKLVTALFEEYVKIFDPETEDDLRKYLEDRWKDDGWNHQERKQFRNRISAIAIAFKLAMRTFEFDEEAGNEA